MQTTFNRMDAPFVEQLHLAELKKDLYLYSFLYKKE